MGGAETVSTITPVPERAAIDLPRRVSPLSRRTRLPSAFGQRLTSPPYPRGRQNKILWVARVSGVGPLRIAAHLMSSDVAVVRHVRGGPGPSIIDLPAAGCWRFDLTWSGYSDQVYVAYEKRERPSERNLA